MKYNLGYNTMFITTLTLFFFSFGDICNYSLVRVQKAYTNYFKIKLEILRDSSISFGKCYLRTFLVKTFYIFIIHTVFRLQFSKENFNKTKLVTCCAKSCSKQSRLNKSVSCNRLPGKRSKGKKDARIKAIKRPVRL